jgi:hypothetical protein
MKNAARAIALGGSMLIFAGSALAQLNLPRPSPKASVKQTIGLTDLTITYSRPAMKGRQIFGGLVPWDQVWRTGANEQTIFEISDDATINGQKLAKGKYSLHTIPGRTEWTVIFNKVANETGNYSYDEANDALRVKVTPRPSPHPHELMTFVIPNATESTAEVVLAWENLMVPFTVGVDTSAKSLAAINAELGRQNDWRIPYQAANWSFQSGANAPDAMKWIDRSIAMSETWSNTSLKARMLAAQGKKAEAVALGEKAVKIGKALPQPPDTSALEKEIAEWKKK